VLDRLSGRGNPEAQFRLARLWLDAAGRPEAAGEMVRKRSSGWPAGLRTEGDLLACRCLMAEGRWSEAARRCSILAASRDPEVRQRAYFLWGEIASAGNDFDEALSRYSRAVRALDGGELANDALARILLISQVKTDKMSALEMLGRAISIRYGTDGEASLRAWASLADSASGTVAGDLALEEMSGLNLGAGRYRQAMENLTRLSQTTGDSLTAARAFHQMGRLALDRGGDRKTAAARWEQGILKYPNTSWAELMRQALESLKAETTP
jgi:tetratricopeptide (TPR) repeat protein